ncbi:unnamed protein product, partial [Phaeothamnion confervicola]
MGAGGVGGGASSGGGTSARRSKGRSLQDARRAEKRRQVRLSCERALQLCCERCVARGVLDLKYRLPGDHGPARAAACLDGAESSAGSFYDSTEGGGDGAAGGSGAARHDEDGGGAGAFRCSDFSDAFGAAASEADRAASPTHSSGGGGDGRE